MRRLLLALAALAVIAAAALYAATMPRALPRAELAALPEGDAARGETWFWAGGCAGCHAAADAEGEGKLRLGGGVRLDTAFGTFVAPNISPHPDDGIGDWSAADFVNAMRRGISPDGQHYYPAFPYTSFTRMQDGNLADLWAFILTLPQVEGIAPEHEVSFPFNIRRGIGLWKLAFLNGAPVIEIDTDDPILARGRYLVEGPGHCAECHTPRNAAFALDFSRWLAGAPAPEGDGRIPNITAGEGGIGDWSASDIAYYLETGFTPDFDSVGGLMVEVQQSLAMLASEDRDAIAAYLKAVPPQASER